MANTDPDPIRREVHFESLEDILADAETQVTATPIGNWTPAQIVGHIAEGIEHSIDGYAERAADEIRAKVRARKHRVLNEGIRPGMKLDDDMKGLLPPDDVTWDDAIEQLRRAVTRARTERMGADHPYLGVLDANEWVQFHCRHAELHFSFLLPAARDSTPQS